MKITTRLTLLFTFLAGTLLLAFSVMVYRSAHLARERDFFQHLRVEATTKATLLFESGLDPGVLQTIYRNNRVVLNEVEVAIYLPDFTLLYHDAVDIDFVKETPELIQRIDQGNEVRFFQEGWQVLGFRYVFQGRPYIITAAAYDASGWAKLDTLRDSMLAGWFVSMLVLLFLGRYMASRALAPVSGMVRDVGQITGQHLYRRLPLSEKHRDELSILAGTFNQMLDRLEDSFEAQRQSVSHMAHEVRTPLAALRSELELALLHERDAGAYREAIERALQDVRRMDRLTTQLLLFARASYDASAIEMEDVYPLDLVLDARTELLAAHPDYTITLEVQESDELPSVRANPLLLRVAFSNVIENACKYSTPPACTVRMTCTHLHVHVEITDEGPGIPHEELEQVFRPFFRSSTTNLASGQGIGLALTQKILERHKGHLDLNSVVGTGTVARITVPASPALMVF